MIGLGPSNIGGSSGTSSAPTTEAPAYVVQNVAGPTGGPGVQITAGALVFCDCSGGTCSLITPASGVYPEGTYFGVVADDNAATNNIFVGGASVRIEDPANAGHFSASVTLSTNSQIVWWVWAPATAGLNGWKTTPLPPVLAIAALANGTADQIVAMNHGASAPGFVSVGGDAALNGSTGAITISKLGGVACSPLATLANGAADQVLAMNHGATAPTWITVGGDLSMASGTYKVVAIGGATPVPITPNELQWVTGAAPKFSQVIAAAAATPASMKFVSQLPNAASTTLVANTPGGYVFDLGVPNALTVAGTEAYLQVTRNGLYYAGIGAWLGNPALAALYLGNGLVPSSSNHSIYYNGGPCLNGPAAGNVSFSIAATINTQMTAAGWQFGGTTSAFGGGVKVLGITDRTTPPTTNPVGGGVLYSEAGALKWRGSSGTVTTIAVA